MILFPAIDLMDGRCVRLTRGDPAAPTVYNDDPVAQARAFQDLGFEWLHVVDLDAALKGSSVNRDAMAAILAAVTIPVQIGGGIRRLEDVDLWLERGAARVILGTVAVNDPDLVKAACRAHPGHIAVGLDAKRGRLATDGWAKLSDLTVVELALRLEDTGVAALIHTDIEKDGTLSGVNVEQTLELARAVSIPVIASGGIASLADVARMLEPDCRILAGAITGRALYDGRLDAATALSMIRDARELLRC